MENGLQHQNIFFTNCKIEMIFSFDAMDGIEKTKKKAKKKDTLQEELFHI